jgi:hypothetical protein
MKENLAAGLPVIFVARLKNGETLAVSTYPAIAAGSLHHTLLACTCRTCCDYMGSCHCCTFLAKFIQYGPRRVAVYV